MSTRITGSSRLLSGAFLVLLLAGCAGGSGGGAHRDSSLQTPGIVIQGEELWAFGGRLLDGMRGRVMGMQVSRPAGGCPLVLLRGQRTIVGSTRPEVYVDGTRMSDTCSLDLIRVGDVARVEIYRGGLSPGARYVTSPNGLIVVFLVGGQYE
jgi:hypothetical protein